MRYVAGTWLGLTLCPLLVLSGMAQQPQDSAVIPISGSRPGKSMVDGEGLARAKSPALTGDRRPLYRLHKSDLVEIRFTFCPEYDQAIAIRPDGFLELKDAGEIFAEGMTVPDLRSAIQAAYQPILRDPAVNVVLKEFEKPYFIAGGQVGRPGKYELRSRATVAEAVAIAGGFTENSRHSQVILFHRLSDGVVESHVLNLKAMLASRNLDEDLELRPGDMLFVPQNRISKLRRYLPVATLSTFFTPAQF